MIGKKTRKEIKIALVKKEMTQVQLADKIGVSKQQLNNVINGIVNNSFLEEKILYELRLTKLRKEE